MSLTSPGNKKFVSLVTKSAVKPPNLFVGISGAAVPPHGNLVAIDPFLDNQNNCVENQKDV